MSATRKRLWPLLAVLVLVLGLVAAGCGDDEEEGGGGAAQEQTPTAEAQQFEPGTPLGDIQQKGEIVIGVKYDVPPFGFNNPQTNEVEGFDVDLGRAVAERLGVEPKFIEAISDNRIPFLQDGTADLILSTMTINEERVGQIAFSDPYFIAKGRILTKKDNAEIKGIEDLAGKRVCTALGSTYEATLKKQAPEADLRLVDSYSECMESLQNGSVDAVSTDDVILTGMIIQDDSLHMVGEELTEEPYGAGIKKGNQELVDFVNETFDEVNSSGRYDEIFQKWVGQYTGAKPAYPDMTVDEAVELVAQQG